MITDFTGGQVNARPFIVCDPMKGAGGADSTGTPFVINTACFTNARTFGQIGNMPRNAVRMPSIFNTDLAFFKNFRIGENREIQLRWETYNVFNKANFRDIDGALAYAIAQVNPDPTKTCTTAGNVCTAVIRQTRNTSFGVTPSSFGTPTSARSPRVMQASIRINF